MHHCSMKHRAHEMHSVSSGKKSVRFAEGSAVIKRELLLMAGHGCLLVSGSNGLTGILRIATTIAEH
jgi:hypothetical protein